MADDLGIIRINYLLLKVSNEMDVILYVVILLGCVSVGYSLLRLGFPEKQSSKKIDKIAYGYLLGIIVFLPAMASIFYLGDNFFFVISGITYTILFIIFGVMRKANKKTDSVELKKEEVIHSIPKKVLTNDEKAIIANKGPESFDSTENYAGGNVINENELKKQIFKDGTPNVIDKLREKTTQMETLDEDKARKVALDRLRQAARGLEKKKDELRESEDDEDEEVGDIVEL